MAGLQSVAGLAKPEPAHTSPYDKRSLPDLPKLDIPPSTGPKPALVSSPTSTFKSQESSSKPWTPVDGESPKASFGMSNAVHPPRPITKDFRPRTGSSKRLSFSSVASKMTTKYGSGKYSGIALVPQPSNDPDDPLVCPSNHRFLQTILTRCTQNWPTWRKNLNFVALLYMVALVGVMKTIFISVNSAVSTANGRSYTDIVALTAAPLMVSAVTGMASVVGAKICGKRPIYLASTAAIFVGVLWSMYVTESYSQNMAARVFQGLGWGAFDTLVLGSLQETFFVSLSPISLSEAYC
jgi:hypothetical protein